jgi:hypothetical protein
VNKNDLATPRLTMAQCHPHFFEIPARKWWQMSEIIFLKAR